MSHGRSRSLRTTYRPKARTCDPRHTASRDRAVEMPTTPSSEDDGVVAVSQVRSAAGECRVSRLVDHEDLRQAGDPEDLQQPVLVADQLERAVVGTHLLQAADEDAEPGRVQEL